MSMGGKRQAGVRAHQAAHSVRRGQDLGQPKIRNLGHSPCVVQQHVVRLAVKPDDAPAVQVHQAARSPQRYVAPILVPAGLAGNCGILADARPQIATLHQLRDQQHLQEQCTIQFLQ